MPPAASVARKVRELNLRLIGSWYAKSPIARVVHMWNIGTTVAMTAHVELHSLESSLLTAADRPAETSSPMTSLDQKISALEEKISALEEKIEENKTLLRQAIKEGNDSRMELFGGLLKEDKGLLKSYNKRITELQKEKLLLQQQATGESPSSTAVPLPSYVWCSVK